MRFLKSLIIIGLIVMALDFSFGTMLTQVDAKPKSRDLSTADVNCITGESVVREVKEAREDVERRENHLKQRIAEVEARERALDEEVQRLTDIRKEIIGLEKDARKKHEEKVTKLVETLEKMSPKNSAKILERVDVTIAVDSMARIKTDRLAKIMNAMNRKRSIQLSEMMVKGVGNKRVLAGK